MMAQLIWIGAVYASAVMCVHALKFRESRGTPRQAGNWLHYILIVRNHEAIVEGVIRAMTVQSLLTGKPVRLTYMVDGSTDQTLRILSALQEDGCSLDMRKAEYDETKFQTERTSRLAGFSEETVIDLRMPNPSIPLPFMRNAGSRGYSSE